MSFNYLSSFNLRSSHFTSWPIFSMKPGYFGHSSLKLWILFNVRSSPCRILVSEVGFSSPLTSSEERFLVTAGWEWEFILLVGLCDTPWEEGGGHIVALQVSTDTGWGMALFLQVMVKFWCSISPSPAVPLQWQWSNTILIVTNGSEILGLQVVFPDPQVSVRQSSH